MGHIDTSARITTSSSALNKKRFAEYSEDASIPDRDLFDRLSRSTEAEDEATLMKKRPREGISFGLVPNKIINKVCRCTDKKKKKEPNQEMVPSFQMLDKSNRHERGEGAHLLRRELDAQQGDLGLLLPYAASFLRFLGAIMGDGNPKVLGTINCTITAVLVVVVAVVVAAAAIAAVVALITPRISRWSCTAWSATRSSSPAPPPS